MENLLKLSNYRIILILLLGLTFTACTEKIKEGNGIVLDSVTKQPIDSVNVDIYLNSVHDDSLFPKVYTDATGKYNVKYEFNREMIHFTKEGYISFVTKLRKNDTIYLEETRKTIFIPLTPKDDSID